LTRVFKKVKYSFFGPIGLQRLGRYRGFRTPSTVRTPRVSCFGRAQPAGKEKPCPSYRAGNNQ